MDRTLYKRSEHEDARASGQGVASGMKERELITGVFYDKKGVRHEYAYIAIGFAYERVERMLNP